MEIIDGWNRYDNLDMKFFKYSGAWSHSINKPNSYYLESRSLNSTSGGYVEFSFEGTAFRVVTTLSVSNTSKLQVTVDGILKNTLDLTKGSGMIVYTAENLKNEPHTVRLTNLESKFFILDAVDTKSQKTYYKYLFSQNNTAYTIENGTLKSLGTITTANASTLFASGVETITKEHCVLVGQQLGKAKIMRMLV